MKPPFASASATVGAFDAKTHLAALLDQVADGATFVISRRGEPVAELRPVAKRARRPVFGADRLRVRLHADFDAPLKDFAGYTS